MTRRQLLRAHVPRTEHDMLRVIEFPVTGEDSVFSRKSVIQRRPWERRQNGESRQIDAEGDGKLDRRVKYVQCVVIETEYEATLHGDTAAV